MYCNKCGSKVRDEAKFCTECGSPIINNQDKYNYNYNTTNNVSDEDLIKEYIGNNYDDFINTKFSIPTFFLGIYYFLYRKMWLYTILTILIAIASFILTFVFELWYLLFIPTIYMIFMSIKFNELYLNIAKKKVEKIKSNNPDKTNQELVNICKKKGGVSILAVILPMVLIFPIVFFVVFFAIMYGFIDALDSEITKEKNYNNDSELKYELPKIFDDDSYSSSNYESYHYSDYESSCDISITNYRTYDDKTAEEYLKEKTTLNMNETVSQINEAQINNFEWKYVEINSPTKKEYKYAAIYNNRLYIIEYKINEDNNKLCSNGYNTFINSLTFSLNNIDNSNTI